MPVSLKDQTVLVVGASSGIGRETALLLVREGANVMATARRRERLETLAAESAAGPGSIAIFAADASDQTAAERMVTEARTRFGSLDAMVFAAGINTPDRSLKRLSPAIWDDLLSVNLNGAFYVTHAVLPHFRNQMSGLMIFVSSISGLAPDASGAAYQASKRGLVALAHAIRVEEKENGIRTSVVCPGLVDTELLNQRPVKPDKETLAKALLPEDVAELIVAIAKLPVRATVPEVQILPTLI
jgi:serine 3-dehydrogenase (NADP+)